MYCIFPFLSIVRAVAFMGHGTAWFSVSWCIKGTPVPIPPACWTVLTFKPSTGCTITLEGRWLFASLEFRAVVNPLSPSLAFILMCGTSLARNKCFQHGIEFFVFWVTISKLHGYAILVIPFPSPSPSFLLTSWLYLLLPHLLLVMSVIFNSLFPLLVFQGLSLLLYFKFSKQLFFCGRGRIIFFISKFYKDSNFIVSNVISCHLIKCPQMFLI